jgi:hypothetical protein
MSIYGFLKECSDRRLKVFDIRRCLVPDLYKGKIGVDAEEASHVSIRF